MTEKKRKIDLSSPEKRSQAGDIGNALLQLKDSESISDIDKDQLVEKLKDFMGDILHEEYIERFDSLSAKLDTCATSTQIQQLEGQLGCLKAEQDKNISKIFDLETENETLKQRITRLESIVGTLEINSNNARYHAINNEQYQRKNNLVVFGVKEASSGNREDCKEKVKSVMSKCKDDIMLDDIDVAHRVGQYNNDKPRPIIVKMKNHGVRWEVLKARKELKGIKEHGSSLSIGEDVTREYMDFLGKIKAKGRNAWFWNGRVFVQRDDGSSITVQIQDDWERKLNDASVRGFQPRRSAPNSR